MSKRAPDFRKLPSFQRIEISNCAAVFFVRRLSSVREKVKTLGEIEDKVEGKKTVALAQFESKHQKYLADAHLTVAEQEKKQGLMAEGQRHFEEVVYAVDFTKAVVAKDEQMIEQLRTCSQQDA